MAPTDLKKHRVDLTSRLSRLEKQLDSLTQDLVRLNQTIDRVLDMAQETNQQMREALAHTYRVTGMIASTAASARTWPEFQAKCQMAEKILTFPESAI